MGWISQEEIESAMQCSLVQVKFPQEIKWLYQ